MLVMPTFFPIMPFIGQNFYGLSPASFAWHYGQPKAHGRQLVDKYLLRKCHGPLGALASLAMIFMRAHNGPSL
jgi:hypothetical protein